MIDITDWSTLQALQADLRVSSCNEKVRKVMSDTGLLLYEKSVRIEKDDLNDEGCLFRQTEKLSDLLYPVIDIRLVIDRRSIFPNSTFL